MCFASEWNHNFRGSTRMCSVCSCEKRTRAPMWATSGWCLFQSQYFLVLIHSRVPVVHQCGQPRTGAHGVLICQDVTSSGPEGKRKGGWGESLDGEKERWHPHVRTHAPVQKTHIEHVCQSISQCPLERLNFCPLYPQRHLNTAHWVHWQCSTPHSYSTTGSLWP